MKAFLPFISLAIASVIGGVLQFVIESSGAVMTRRRAGLRSEIGRASPDYARAS